MTAEQTIQRPIQPPFASAACPRCGHRCEVDPEQPLAPVRCPDCGGEFVGGQAWEWSLANPVGYRRFAWALILSGIACLMWVLSREAGVMLAEKIAQASRSGGVPEHFWAAPIISLLSHVAQLVSIPAQWMLLRIAQSEARSARSIRAARGWLSIQVVSCALQLFLFAIWLTSRAMGSMNQAQTWFSRIDQALGGAPTIVMVSLEVAISAGGAIMLLLLGLPSARVVGGLLKPACAIIAVGVGLHLWARATLPIMHAANSLTISRLLRSAEFPVIYSAATHWIPSATVAIGGLMLLRTGLRMRSAR